MIRITVSLIVYSTFFCLSLIGCKEAPPIPPTDSDLVAAVMARRPQLVDSLLQAGAAPDSRDEEGTPVLILAVNEGQDEMVHDLVNAGATVNARREAYFKSTALMEVGVRNAPELAAWLIDQGADLSMQDTLGDTALNWASYYGHQELAALYLDRGADWSLGGRQGTAIDIALHRGHRALARYFVERGAGKKLPEKERQLFTAMEQGDLEQVKDLIEKDKLAADATDELGTPALVWAAEFGQTDIVMYLLRHDADINGMNRVGETALARAARFGHRVLVNRLLSLKADPDLAGETFGLSPVINAAQAGHGYIIQELIASGASPDVPERINGFTPLMLATAGGHVDAVKALLAGGASVYIKSADGAGLYDMLRYSNSAEIGDILRERMLEEEE